MMMKEAFYNLTKIYKKVKKSEVSLLILLYF